ncbi:MAG TPA: ADP-ribosylglycohydrolase family protein, partial [Deltaproteobacteria bacterium]|nr:ADP-ribosylglycohydrolase family protein [Deltaproteobacteria bacterium]
MSFGEVFYRFGAALVIGFLVGIQREYAYTAEDRPDGEEDELFAGARTFALLSVYGCACAFAGDALGSLVEFESAESIRRKYPGGLRELADGGTFNTIAGQPTDDSEMALMLARTLVERGSYDAEATFEAYKYWFNSHPF